MTEGFIDLRAECHRIVDAVFDSEGPVPIVVAALLEPLQGHPIDAEDWHHAVYGALLTVAGEVPMLGAEIDAIRTGAINASRASERAVQASPPA